MRRRSQNRVHSLRLRCQRQRSTSRAGTLATSPAGEGNDTTRGVATWSRPQQILCRRRRPAAVSTSAGGGRVMNFHVIQRRDLANANSPFRAIQDNGDEVEWVNRFLDQERIRSVAETSLRSYAYDLLHYLRWWAGVHRSSEISEKALTESALLDYIRFQTNHQPPPAAASVNRRIGIAERALQLAFPQVQPPFLPGFQHRYWRPSPLGTGKPRPAISRPRVRTPKRVIIPLSADEVAQ